MNEISRKFEQLISSTQKKLAADNRVMPIKTDQGILVGNVLIACQDSLKTLSCKGEIIYANVNLNQAAITLANLTALNKNHDLREQIYRNDQEYGKWYRDYQLLLAQYQRARTRQDYDKADIFQSRYELAKSRAESAKRTVMSLIGS